MGIRRVLITVGPEGADAAPGGILSGLLEHAQEAVFCPCAETVRRPEADGRDAADAYAAAKRGNHRALLACCEADAFEHACRAWLTGDRTICVRANGSTVETAFESERQPVGELLPELPPERKVWIGMGSNTWRSDLNLNIRYRRTSGPADRPGASLHIPWMAGIPGTIGGWIKMNAGAFGHSISEALEEVRVDGVWLRAEECGFAYRHSEISGEISDFRLKPADQIRCEGDAGSYLLRRRKFPAGTFGSFFKNPPGDFAGRLLELAGAKSMSVGAARVWAEHANVIVADSGATPSDVLALARLMKARAFKATGVWLEPEVCGIAM